MNWYCFRTHNKKEKLAAANVANSLKVEVFCPMISDLKRMRQGKIRCVEAMFPCYAFARINLMEHLQDLKYAQGVQRILQVGQDVPAIPDDFITELRSHLNENDVWWIDHPTPRNGNMVRIDCGPFQNFIGKIIQACSGSERLCILLDILGQQVPVQIHSDQISAIDAYENDYVC